MSYYTEADRKRASEVRQRKRLFQQLIKSPEDAYDILGFNVPLVQNKPTLQEFDLPDDIQDSLKRADEEYIRSEKPLRIVLAVITSVVLVGIFIFFMRQADQSLHPENYFNYRLINNFVAWGGAISTMGGLIAGGVAWTWALGVKPKETHLHRQYKKYKEQLSYYDYWQRKKNKDHWNNMTGHAFELSVANLFRSIGFTANVSNRGGDGGVDILIAKNERKIAVQCKRYKSPVGPHVIRDLWGTMQYLGFEEGCIITTTGFTSGVKEFAKDKGIFLIDLNDILKATSDGKDSKILAHLIKDFDY
ncbi:MAG: restriction endonuclease [Candidatus Levyibacteriota bacterium]